MPASTPTRRANKATGKELSAVLSTTHQAGGRKFNISAKTAADLSDDERDQIWHMFEENMYSFYVASSFGWNPRSKKREMFDTRSRFVIARQDDNDSDALALFSAIVAYTIFRFDREEGRDVIYCYELQVSKHARRCGLGKLLTQHLSDIGAKWNMEKVMLTVFKANQSALAFYTSVGFSIDETSPDHPANVEDQILDTCDYSILSLPIP